MGFIKNAFVTGTMALTAFGPKPDAKADEKPPKPESTKPAAVSKVGSEIIPETKTSELFVPSPRSERVAGTTIAANSPSTTIAETDSETIIEAAKPSAKYIKNIGTAYTRGLISEADKEYLLKNNWEVGAGGKSLGNLFAVLQGLTNKLTIRSLKGYDAEVAAVYDIKTEQAALSSFIHTKNPEIGFKLAKLVGYAVLGDGGAGKYRYVVDKETIAGLLDKARDYNGPTEKFFATHVNHLVKARLNIFADEGFIGASSVDFHLNNLISSGIPVLASLNK